MKLQNALLSLFFIAAIAIAYVAIKEIKKEPKQKHSILTSQEIDDNKKASQEILPIIKKIMKELENQSEPSQLSELHMLVADIAQAILISFELASEDEAVIQDKLEAEINKTINTLQAQAHSKSGITLENLTNIINEMDETIKQLINQHLDFKKDNNYAISAKPEDNVMIQAHNDDEEDDDDEDNKTPISQEAFNKHRNALTNISNTLVKFVDPNDKHSVSFYLNEINSYIKDINTKQLNKDTLKKENRLVPLIKTLDKSRNYMDFSGKGVMGTVTYANNTAYWMLLMTKDPIVNKGVNILVNILNWNPDTRVKAPNSLKGWEVKDVDLLKLITQKGNS
ncbi:MAG: hypothetical protein JO129_01655 [Candidatus Dependentiae bacterium]|nr:hypothetical protein [Candidatus Dependentiae bacterium]